MGKLKNVKGDTYYIKGPVNIGVYVYDETNCILIDTGLDDDTGRKALKTLDEEGLIPKVIINTHSHADHFGGNNLIVKRTDAEVMASKIEAAVIMNPYMEPFYLYSAHPLKKLQNKFLMAKPSRVNKFIELGEYNFGKKTLRFIDLKGHSPGQLGVATPDSVLFTADSYFSPQIINKYKLPYFVNIKDTITTLNKLKEAEYKYFIPCHGKCKQNIMEEIQANLKAINETVELLTTILKQPMTREQIISEVCREYKIKLNINQYYLTQSCISAFLSFMTEEGILKTLLKDKQLKWVIK